MKVEQLTERFVVKGVGSAPGMYMRVSQKPDTNVEILRGSSGAIIMTHDDAHWVLEALCLLLGVAHR